MSMTLFIHAGPYHPKPEITVYTFDETHHAAVTYGNSTINVFGPSREQCDRFAAALLAMWDEPAEEPAPKINSAEEYREITGRDVGLPDRIVKPDPTWRAQQEANGSWSVYYGGGFRRGGLISEIAALSWIEKHGDRDPTLKTAGRSREDREERERAIPTNLE